MTIETTKQVTSKVEVPVPSFWKRADGIEFVAALNENNVITIYKSSSFTNIKHGELHVMHGDLELAHNRYNLCTKQEFMEAYSKVLKSLSLQPELI